MFVLFPQLSANRVAYLSERLDPRVSTNEWQLRINGWRAATIAGPDDRWRDWRRHWGRFPRASVSGGGELAEAQVTGVEQVEGGYASVGQQWGFIGLLLWLGWTTAWTGRLWRCSKGARGTPFAGVGLLITSWVVIFLFVSFVAGFQVFQNYYANAYFGSFPVSCSRCLLRLLPETVRDITDDSRSADLSSGRHGSFNRPQRANGRLRPSAPTIPRSVMRSMGLQMKLRHPASPCSPVTAA